MKYIKNIKPFLSRINKYHLLSLVVIFFFAAIVTYANLGLVKEFIGDDAGVGYHFPATQLDLVTHMWDSYTFPGRSNVIATLGLVQIGFIGILNKIGLTPVIIDRVIYFLVYFISGLGMYFLANNICNRLNSKSKHIWVASLSAALFYIFNNLTMTLLSFPPTNYIYSYVLLPWIFLLYLEDFHLANELWKRLIFSLVFLLLLGGNPSNTITIVGFLLIYEIFFRVENKIIHNWKKFSITLLFIIVFSSFSFLPTMGNKGNPYGEVVGNDVSISFNSTNTSIDNLFRIMGHPAQENYTIYKFLLSNKSAVANYLILGLALLFLLKRKITKLEIYFFVIFLLFLFFAKSNHPPFYSINEWMFDNIPFFEMYRASYFKFIYFCVFSLSVLLAISLSAIFEKIQKLSIPRVIKIFSMAFPAAIILISAAPFFRGEIVRDIHKTNIPVEYLRANEHLDKIRTDFSILSLPQSNGSTYDWGNGNYFGSGGIIDPYLLGRPVWTNGWFLPGLQASDNLNAYKNLLGKSNIKYILLHKDIPEKYYFRVGMRGKPMGQTRYKDFADQLSKDPDWGLVQDNSYFSIYEIKPEIYNQHFSLPAKAEKSEILPEALLEESNQRWPTDTVIFLQKQNGNKEDAIQSLRNQSSSKDFIRPTVEFKKINATKYRVILHGAKEEFPLVFNEGYQEGWKVYLSKTTFKIDGKSQLAARAESAYQKFTYNENYQSSQTELKELVSKGLIVDLGDKDKIKFVSKNLSGIIQNDNLNNGKIYESWFRASVLDERSHLQANGYANSWIINPQKLCSDNNRCQKNQDGSYDMDLLIEFWPQRLFYLGIGLSGVFLLCVLVYLLFGFVKRKI